jgi:hypothetical protein
MAKASMSHEELDGRCVELFQHPAVQLDCGHPRMFRETRMKENPAPGELTEPKVDLIRHMIHRGDPLSAQTALMLTSDRGMGQAKRTHAERAVEKP